MRRRVKLAYIENTTRRKASYMKRKQSLLKKVEELSTLCGIEACAIIYSSFNKEPEIWPPSNSAVQDVLDKFKGLSVIEQNRNMMNQESFTKRRICKLQEQCKKLSKENRQKEIKFLVSQCLAGEAQQNFSLADLNDMRWSIYFSLKSLSHQIETIKTQTPPPAPAVMIPSTQTTGGGMMPTLQRTGRGNGYQPVVAPEMPKHNPQNPISGMDAFAPNEQFAGFDDFDWDLDESLFSFIFNNDHDNGVGPSFTSP